MPTMPGIAAAMKSGLASAFFVVALALPLAAHATFVEYRIDATYNGQAQAVGTVVYDSSITDGTCVCSGGAFGVVYLDWTSPATGNHYSLDSSGTDALVLLGGTTPLSRVGFSLVSPNLGNNGQHNVIEAYGFPAGGGITRSVFAVQDSATATLLWISPFTGDTGAACSEGSVPWNEGPAFDACAALAGTYVTQFSQTYSERDPLWLTTVPAPAAAWLFAPAFTLLAPRIRRRSA